MNPNETLTGDTVNEQATVYWQNYLQMTGFLLGMGFIVAIGLVLSIYLSSTWIAVLSGLSIVILIALLLSRLIKPLVFLQLPLLILACFVSGIMLSQIASNTLQLQIALLILLVNYLMLTTIHYILKFEFKGFNLLLVLLAISFSVVGSLLVFVEASTLLQLIWTLATFLCLDILLYTLIQQVLQTKDQSILPMLSGVVLLHIALFMSGIFLVIV